MMKAILNITLSLLLLSWASGFRSFPKPLPASGIASDTIFNLGRPATSADIQRWDIDVRPDGKGLPRGSGTARKGKTIFAQKCAACHGVTGVEGPNDKLVSTDSSKVKAIGNYWPYATTVFDYIRRAMPFNQPGTLTDEEVYSLTAFLLEANQILKPGTELNAQTLPAVQMPALKKYILDDRTGGPIIR